MHTTGPFEVRTFAGGHFYFREHRDDLLRHLAERARAAAPGTGPVGAADPAPSSDAMAARLRAELGLRVPVRTILENPTVGGLSALLSRTVADRPDE